MMKHIIGLFFACILLLNTSAQEINSQLSRVNFKVKNLGFNSVKGTFSNMTGTVNFKEHDLTTYDFNVCVSTSTVNTGNKKRDEHLKNADFFNSYKFPEICFVSKSFEKVENMYMVSGELTMHGVTKNVSIPFRHQNNQLVGDFSVNRFDYGVGEGTGSFMVGNEVQISILCVLQ